MQAEETVTTQRAHSTLNLSIPDIATVNSLVFEELMESTSISTGPTNVTMINESMTQNNSSQIGSADGILYLYGVPPLILFCVISVVVNIKVLMSVFWIRRPLSPTLYISLSLAGADAFSSSVLGIGLVLNSFIPNGLEIKLKDMDCFLLALEVVRLGGVIITVFHLMALAINHYLGILRPLHYLTILTYRNTTILLVLLWVLPISFFALYFNLIENDGFQSEGCRTHTFLSHKQFRTLFSSLFFGPFALMICIYVHIFYIVKRHQATRLRFRRAGSSARARASEALRSNSRQMARNVKAIHTTLYILGSFVIGWMPGVTMYMLVCNDCVLQLRGVSARVMFFIYAIINGLIILKTLVNPIIYAARMHEIKIAMRRMHDAFCGCSKLTRFTTNRGISRIIYSSEESRQSRTSRMFQNMSIRKGRNGSTYTCTGYNIHEYGNTPV
ncbi:PREDICTED: trace amine-associated receptor 4-like isoform X1 [Vollenhovia emeryi]|uniref:trace amine-associated receptor 4-like isoform X1 n=1 Tax=Vollenhovia emeryi TaxID=411798 RepID=UPI0005F3AA56|nr:PREDICTED: trace amine-associated receptor 4-like isoform X1 [Vollenhovia emeryi]